MEYKYSTRTGRQKGRRSAPGGGGGGGGGVNHTGSILSTGTRSTCFPFHTCSLPLDLL